MKLSNATAKKVSYTAGVITMRKRTQKLILEEDIVHQLHHSMLLC